MKKRLGLFLLLAAVCFLAACGQYIFAPPADLLPEEQTVDIGDGVAAQFSFLSGGKVTIEYGDEVSEVIECDDSARTAVRHLYTATGTYIVKLWRAAREIGRVKVFAVATLPVVHVPFWWQGWMVDARETIDLGITFREVGCDAGTGLPLYYTGVFPGDGWTEVRLFAWDANGVPIGVFDFGRPLGDQAVWGEWLPLPDYHKQAFMLTVFMGYYDITKPKLPLAPRATAKNCDDPNEWPDPPSAPEPGDPAYQYHMKFLLEARNQYTPEGGEPDAMWRIWYSPESGCS
jgi:hypothetical protein